MKSSLIKINQQPPLLPSILSVVLYEDVFCPSLDDLTSSFAELFSTNQWQNIWVDGVFSYDHYHVKAYEVLGCARGWIKLQLGGEGGKEILMRKNQAVLLPKGISHKRLTASEDLIIVGAYPQGEHPDLNTVEQKNYEKHRSYFKEAPLPSTDPITATKNPSINTWEKEVRERKNHA